MNDRRQQTKVCHLAKNLSPGAENKSHDRTILKTLLQSVQFLKQPIQTTPSCCSCCQWPHMVTLLCTVIPLRLQGKVVSH